MTDGFQHQATQRNLNFSSSAATPRHGAGEGCDDLRGRAVPLPFG